MYEGKKLTGRTKYASSPIWQLRSRDSGEDGGFEVDEELDGDGVAVSCVLCEGADRVLGMPYAPLSNRNVERLCALSDDVSMLGKNAGGE